MSDAGALDIRVESGTKQTSLAIGGTVTSKIGLTDGEQSGEVISTSANETRERLQNDFNDVLTQIDDLSKDASYNGINLLNGDDLKVTFNENGSSSLTISGVTFDSNHLGLNAVTGDKFQDNDQIDSIVGKIDSALGSLRSQASKFGSNLSTVQTRQDFTKNMINTLQTGSDDLVLADTNEEGGQPARPADPPAAVVDGSVDGLAGRPGGAPPLLISVHTRKSDGGASAPPFFVARSAERGISTARIGSIVRGRSGTMALKVELKPGERFILGTSVITNDNQRTRLYIQGDAPVLREKDILTAETADTPCQAHLPRRPADVSRDGRQMRRASFTSS